jgi:hypothetical protein
MWSLQVLKNASTCTCCGLPRKISIINLDQIQKYATKYCTPLCCCKILIFRLSLRDSKEKGEIGRIVGLNGDTKSCKAVRLPSKHDLQQQSVFPPHVFPPHVWFTGFLVEMVHVWFTGFLVEIDAPVWDVKLWCYNSGCVNCKVSWRK